MRDLDRARDDLGVFADLVGWPLRPWQAEALRLEARTTVVVAPRQSGKSRSLAVLAVHRAYRRPGQRVLIVSAGEEAARRLLAEVRAIVTASPLLARSVLDERAGLVTLSNGSEIRSVPASERQVRGWSVDLLLIDEAALVPDDLILGAALPTTAARPDARIVMASSATTASGAFYDHVRAAGQGSEFVRAFRWALADASWISPAAVEAARQSMTELRFAAEYLGEFASSADALFPRHVLDRTTADVTVPGFEGLAACRGLLGGQDWGATVDRSALVALARLERPAGMFAVVCAHAWRSGTPLDGPGGVIGDVTEAAGAFELLTAERNGLGEPLVQELKRRVPARWAGRATAPRVVGVHTSGELKSAVYSALRLAFEQGRLVLPASAEALRRELLLLRVQMLPAGGERIEAGAGHDDLADALMLAAAPYRERDGGWRCRLRDVLERERLDTGDGWAERTPFVETGASVKVPRAPVLVEARVPGPVVTVTSYMPTGAPPVIRRGGLELVGDRYLDVDRRGQLVPPPGYVQADASNPAARRAAESARRQREADARERRSQRNGPSPGRPPHHPYPLTPTGRTSP